MEAHAEELNAIVHSIKDQLSDTEIIAILTSDGTVLASNFTTDTPSKIGEIVKNFVRLSTKTCRALGGSESIEGWIKGQDGTIAIYPAGKAMVGVTTSPDANFAMLNMVCRSAATKVTALLG